MKISILVFNLSGNCLVRTYPIAKVLERHYEVEVIGPAIDGDIYGPYRDEFVYKSVQYDKNLPKLSKMKSRVSVIKKIIDNISGEIIYAFKPRVTSFGVGLLAKYKKGLPLILDIEDWEAEPFYSASFMEKTASLKRVCRLDSDLVNYALEPLTKLADEKTVVSNFLQNKFGGIKLPHGADTDYFDPESVNRQANRESWNIDKEKIIMFCGLPRKHKGLEELLTAIKITGRKDLKLMIVGADGKDEYVKKLIRLGEECIILTGCQPHSKMPAFLSMADLVVLPQRKTPFAMAQVPGKVFEAMAMAKSIVATNVSDMPEILDGCGWVVEPESPEQLAESIMHVLDNSEEAKERAFKARRRCMERYSWDAMEKVLLSIFRGFEPN